MTDTKNTLSHADLMQFHGDLERYRTLNRRVIYTPGVKYLAEQGSAYWLIDAIASYYGTDVMRRAIAHDSRLADMHFWRLDVDQETRSAKLTAEADSGVEPFITQHIPYTDFPLDHVRIWSGFDSVHWTLYLPSEH